MFFICPFIYRLGIDLYVGAHRFIPDSLSFDQIYFSISGPSVTERYSPGKREEKRKIIHGRRKIGFRPPKAPKMSPDLNCNLFIRSN